MGLLSLGFNALCKPRDEVKLDAPTHKVSNCVKDHVNINKMFKPFLLRDQLFIDNQSL